MKSLKYPGFEAYRCRRCGHYWASNATMPGLLMNSFCPTCIPKMTHVLADRPLTMVEVHDDDRRSHLAVIAIMRAKLNRHLKADMSRLTKEFPDKPTVRDARKCLRCDIHHAIKVLWYAYEMPKIEKEMKVSA